MQPGRLPDIRFTAEFAENTVRPTAATETIYHGVTENTELKLRVIGSLELDGQRNEQSTLRCLIPLGEWLKQYSTPSSLLAIHDVGAVPYYSQLQTMDSNPQSLTDVHIAKNGFSPEYFFGRNPHFAVFSSEGPKKRKNFFPQYAPLMKDPRFRNRYKLVGISQYDHVFRSFWVYARRDVPLKKESLEKFPLGLRTK